jgi:hypothetical protein
MTSKRKITSSSEFSTVKRNRRSMSLEIKYKIIKLADSGESNTEIARKLDIPRTTVVSIMKDKARILEEVKGQAPMQAKCIRQRAGLIAEMEKLLIVWLDDQTRCQVHVSPSVIQAKARSLFEYLKSRSGGSSKEETFQGSKGWFQRFKSRFSVHNVREQTEVANTEEVTPSEFPRLARGTEGSMFARQGKKNNSKQIKNALCFLLYKNCMICTSCTLLRLYIPCIVMKKYNQFTGPAKCT